MKARSCLLPGVLAKARMNSQTSSQLNLLLNYRPLRQASCACLSQCLCGILCLHLRFSGVYDSSVCACVCQCLYGFLSLRLRFLVFIRTLVLAFAFPSVCMDPRLAPSRSFDQQEPYSVGFRYGGRARLKIKIAARNVPRLYLATFAR